MFGKGYVVLMACFALTVSAAIPDGRTRAENWVRKHRPAYKKSKLISSSVSLPHSGVSVYSVHQVSSTRAGLKVWVSDKKTGQAVTKYGPKTLLQTMLPALVKLEIKSGETAKAYELSRALLGLIAVSPTNVNCETAAALITCVLGFEDGRFKDQIVKLQFDTTRKVARLLP